MTGTWENIYSGTKRIKFAEVNEPILAFVLMSEKCTQNCVRQVRPFLSKDGIHQNFEFLSLNLTVKGYFAAWVGKQ